MAIKIEFAFFFLNAARCAEILTTCSANVVANNTYWQSPLFGVDSGSVCVMALHLNTGVIRQNLQSICQVRLVLNSYSLIELLSGF